MLKGILIFIVFIIIAGYFIYGIATFSLYNEDDINMVAEIEVPNKEFNLRLYYLPSNATSQSYIQVRKVITEEGEEIIANFERYNFIVSHRFVNDSTLQLVLRDTLFLNRKIDTVKLKLP